ncbi:uncharacterized protein LOC142097443 [Mixophyes fleayi]|uniref:uncharacterized protein LOC142097443 n=1 Tax=Mixophyes fleayi TaxID=3061075 RepID=UPI003F4E21F6
MDVINTLSSSQMAEVTIQQINNEEVACQIAGRLQQFGIADVYIYLDTCYELYLQLNKPKLINTDIGLEILSSCIPTIKNELPSYSLSDWEALCVRLKPFIHSINNEQLSALLASADSDGYTTIIRCMSEAFDGFTQDILESLYEVIQGYLNNHMSDSGVFPVSGEDSSAAVTRLLGKFSVFTSYGDLQRFISNFNGVSAVPILSPQQMADCALSGDVLSNEAKAQAIIAAVSNLSFIQLEIFLSSFQATAEQKNIVSLPNLKIRGFLFSAIYAKVQFSSFTDDQFMDYFFGKLNLLLPSMTASHFQQIPDSINCAAFRIIIAACSSHYKVLSEVDKKGISDQALTYLKTQKMSTGSACPTNTGNSGELLNSNFGLFSEYVTLGDILQLYEDFDCLSAVKYFTPMQLASCTVNSDALTDKDKMAKCTDETNSDTIGYFMDAFNDGLSQKGITELPNVQVKKFILGEVFCKLRPILPSFTTTDCTNWFQERLKLFRDSIDAKQLSYLSDSSCDCLSAIMGGLNEAENPENPGSVCDFVIQALQKKKSDTGAACTGNGLDSGVWLVKYFGKYSASAEWSDIFYLNANFQVVENADKLTPVQLAKACTNTNIIRNVTAIDIVVSTFTGRVSDYQSFLETVRDVVLKDSSLMPNKKVCGSFLMGAANIMFKGVPELSLEQTKHLVTTMDYLLPSINATVLDQMPMDISCKQYQIVVEGIVQNFGISPIQMKKDIIAFQLTFLNEKVVTDGDACSAGIRNSAQYAEKNFGESCSMIPAEGVAAIYPLIDQIHFTQYCSLS